MVVEVERYTGTPFEGVKESYDYLNNAAFVKRVIQITFHLLSLQRTRDRLFRVFCSVIFLCFFLIQRKTHLTC